MSAEITKIEINGEGLPVTPSDVQVGTEIIRNAERALDGTMCIDVVAEKAELQILWGMLSQAEYRTVMRRFPKDGTVTVKTAAGLLDEGESGKVCYVSETVGQPMFLDDSLYWQDVTVTLTEV